MGWISELATEMVAVGKEIASDGGALADVTHEPWIGQDGDGSPEYGDAVTIPALIEYGVKQMVDSKGHSIVTTARIYLLQPIDPYSTGRPWFNTTAIPSNREEPVDPRDRFTLPNGSKDRIVAIGGIVSGDTDYPYMFEISVGKNVRN